MCTEYLLCLVDEHDEQDRLSPSPLVLVRRTSRFPNKIIRFFLRAMKAGKDMGICIVLTAVSSALRIAPSI